VQLGSGFLLTLANANEQADAGEYLREVSWIYLQILRDQSANIHIRRIRCSQPKQIRHDTEYYIFAPRKRRLGVLPDLFDLTKVDCTFYHPVLIASNVMN
jgi:60S ribosome subunit biogenesis protein NIP7